MTWKLEYNSELRIIDLVYSGNVSGPDMRETTSRAISLSQEHGITDFLVDASNQEQAGTVTDVHELPQQYVEDGADRQKVRVAYVRPISPDLQELGKFFENVCVNRGWHVQSFTNRRDAIGWLLRS